MRRFLLTALLFVLPASAAALPAAAAPSAELWARWQRHDPAGATEVDYTAWEALLGRVVVAGADGINRVDYAALAGPEAAALDGVIAALAAVPVSALDRDRQMAFWINLYNALTLQVVARHHPVDSIRDIDISPGWFSDGPWDAVLISVEGEALTLNDIEHRILRPIWRDPRIHYAVNCASLGCPNLAQTPYRAGQLEGQLESAARDFVNHPRGVMAEQGRVTASRIYDWYVEDFGTSEAEVLAHLRRYAAPGLADRLAEAGAIAGYAYDWNLNGLER